MKTWKLTPKNIDIAKYVECYWFLEKEFNDVSNSYPKLNPDPSAHLIFASTQQKYQYNQNMESYVGYGSHWIYPHRKTFIMDHSKEFRIVGVKFNIGALYALDLSHSLPSLDWVEDVDITKLVGLESDCEEILFDYAMNSPSSARDFLDSILIDWISKSREDRHAEITRKIIPLLSTTPISKIGDLLHRSQRTIERSFLKTTKLTLKQCKSMVRLEEILEHLYKLDREHIDWGILASTFEFSDQPHLIRYLKDSIGETPEEYSQKRDLTIDIYGNFEIP